MSEPFVQGADQPPRIKGTGRQKMGLWRGHQTEAAFLKDHPGKWFMILKKVSRDQASHPAGLINKGIAEDFKPDHDGHFEAVTRRNEVDSTRHDLWAVYVPTGPGAPEPKGKPRSRRTPR